MVLWPVLFAGLSLPVALLVPASVWALPPCGFAPVRGDALARGVDRPPDGARQYPSDVVPLLLHAPPGFSEYDAHAVLGALETAWLANRAWGMQEPPADLFGPDDRYDAYLTEMQYGGFVRPESFTPSQERVACVSHLQLHRAVPLDALLSIAHHELRHAFQLATDCTEPSNLAEADATFVQDWSMPAPPFGLAQYGAAFQAAPERALNGFEAGGAVQYGASLFRWYLAERFGDGTPGFATILWQGARQPDFVNEPDWLDALSAWLAFEGESLEEAVAEFAVWRLFAGGGTGSPWSRSVEWPEDLGLAEHARHAGKALPVADLLPAEIEPWGFGHVVLGDLPAEGELEVVGWPEGSGWAVVVVRVLSDGGWDSSTLPVGDGLVRSRVSVGGAQELHLLAVSLAPHDPDAVEVFERDRRSFRYSLSWVAEPTPAAGPPIAVPPDLITGGRGPRGCAALGGAPGLLVVLLLRRRR